MARLFRTLLLSAAALRAQVSVLTWHNDSARTGQNLQETLLTTANVNSATFGRLATLAVDGKVDAQPLYVPGVAIPGQGTHNVLYVATEHGSLYAFDADTFAQLLKVSLLGANETTATVSCTQVTPEIGITGTPAIDLQAGPHGMIFAVSQSQDTSHAFHHRLHALDLPTLTEQLGGPVNITATYPGSGAENTFNPTEHVARPALLISNGVVYTSWGSHCDGGNYAGWILSYSETTLAQVGVLNVVPNGNDGGIWSAGSGPAADTNGNIYALIGNGTFDPTLNASGFPVNGDYGNAMIKVSTSGALSVVDYFTMSNSVNESNGDQDFGSAGLVLLPPLDNGMGTDVSLAVGAGKDSNIYVVDQTNLGKFNTNTDSIYQQLSGALPSGTWSSPAWFNGNLYYAGSGDNLRQFPFVNGQFSSTPKKSTATFPFPGSTPSISANGTSNGIVWAMQNSNPAVLHAYDAANFPNELYNSNQAANSRDHFGAGNKYIVPTIVKGKVYVGTTNGVGIFGLFPSIGITKSHTGNFAQGQQGAVYTLTVSNAAGVSPTTGAVTVTETVPVGLTLAGMSGTGWTCPTGGNTCTRSDALAASSSYPAITVTVNVASNAPASVTNTATVAGGGDSTSTNKTATDVTIISAGPAPPQLTSPLNGATGVSRTPTLTWSAAAGATSYDVYLGTSATPAFVVNTVGTSYAPSTLLPNQIYYWQIVARNSVGTSASSVWSFTTVPLLAPAGVSPASGSGTTQTFTFTFTDPAGFADLNVLDVLVSTFLDGRAACYFALAPTGATTGYLYLVDDADDGGYAPGSPMPLPSSNSVSNGQCTLNGAGSSISASGNQLTLNLAITFNPAFGGNKAFYMAARSKTQNSGWQALGTWKVPGTAPLGPAVGGVSPARSTSSGQTYTFTFTDTNGFLDLFVLDILTNSVLNGANACYIAYVPTTPTNGYLYLVDDAGDGGYAPGSPVGLSSGSVLQNSQCAINTAASSASASGNTLTLNLALTFKAAFAGNQVFFLAARNNGTGNSGWQAAGSVTVP
jgi:Domain of unknown function DUF11